MSKKKRQSLTILVLCIILVCLGAGYFFASKYQKNKEEAEEESDEEVVLYSLEEDQITKIHYSNSKADLTLVKENDAWKLEENKDFPVDQSKIEAMVSAAASATAKRTVTENCSDLSEYKLEEPTLEIEITDKDGNQKMITYGMESIAAEGCYAYTDDKKKIYVVSSSITTDFDYSQNELMELPKIPEINTEYITSYSIENKKGADFKAVYDKENSQFKNIYGWDITKPYSQIVAGDQDGLQTAFSSATTIEFTEGISYHASERELKQYGLKSPEYTLSMKYYTVKSDSKEDEEEGDDTTAEIAEEDKEYHDFKLLIGAQDDLQENYYVKLEDDPGIYLLSAELVQSIVDLDAFSCVYQNPCPVNTDALQKISLKYNGKEYNMTLSKEQKSDDTTDVEYNYTAKINGKGVDDEKFRTAYEAFGDITYSSQIKKNVKPSSDTAIATITFTEEGRKSTVSFLPYDGVNFYRVDVDGVCQFVSDKNTIDTALQNLINVD